MDSEFTSADLCDLLRLSRQSLAVLVEKGIVVRGEKRGRYKLESVPRYCEHLREQAAGRGGEVGASARERLGQAQAALAEAKAAQIRGETVPVADVEQFWRGKLRAFRNRVLAVPFRLRDLTARQNVTLTQELRSALHELADG